ncbi:hypothetical protein AV926_17660 [Myroides marinus]|uniref:Uncharacterized protein n=1 Tax=Myroides marinus TaxID=703342 RepID=A0A163V569_9FLAO|nr:hypothetical protein [Myroides marinus]KZE74351.1 hypothetical protein AV926_17660 [Myroides marinus]
MKKKETSLLLLQVLQEYYNKGKEIYTMQKGGIISFVDKDKKSDFHFIINSENCTGNNHIVNVNIKPSSMVKVFESEYNMHVKDLKKYLDEWISWITLYNQMKHVEDIEDPIVEAFAEEYYDSFEIIDDDADVKPYSIKQIGYIETLLLGLGQEIKQNREEYVNQSSLEVVAEIEYRIEDIMATIYQSTKKTIAKKISRLFGFIAKEGGPLLREAIKTVVNEVIKIGVKEVFKIE